eukprot:jgi/Astpho2/8302/Aster-x1508
MQTYETPARGRAPAPEPDSWKECLRGLSSLMASSCGPESATSNSPRLYGHGIQLFCMAADPQGKVLAPACRAQSPSGAAIWLWHTTTEPHAAGDAAGPTARRGGSAALWGGAVARRGPAVGTPGRGRQPWGAAAALRWGALHSSMARWRVPARTVWGGGAAFGGALLGTVVCGKLQTGQLAVVAAHTA